MEDVIYGVSLEFMAEMLSKESALKAQHGEPAYQPYFQEWLGSKGTDWNTYSYAYQGWWERLEADPSGQLHAQFATLQERYQQRMREEDAPQMPGAAPLPPSPNPGGAAEYLADEAFETVAIASVPVHTSLEDRGIAQDVLPANTSTKSTNGLIAALQKIPFFRSLLYALGF